MNHSARGKRRLAYHEAGHAVACIAVGQRFKFATVVPSGDYAGVVHVHAINLPLRNAVTEKSIRRVVLYAVKSVTIGVAGAYAEAKYRKRQISLDSLDSKGDWAHLLALAPILNPSGENRGQADFVAEAFVNARAIIRAYWPDVCRVAEALIEKKTLSEKEIRALVPRRTVVREVGRRKTTLILMRGGEQIGKSAVFHS